MNRLIKAVASALPLLFCWIPNMALAEDAPAEHLSGALGFHDTRAPVGVRWWLGGQKIGIDVGFGYTSTPAPSFADEKLKAWAIEGGVPIVVKSWSKVHMIFRPGVLYQSAESELAPPPAAFDTEKTKTLTVSGEIEGEVFIADNFSVSASHGVAYRSIDPPGPGDKITSFTTLGNNFTEVGFHIYFFGGSGQ